ncbi:MAG: mRNA splicing protein prp18 [Bogoriella megaspora]|nr:MAG: mRNA splicing protein prp18 [Bogoriella megaspora]
MDFASLMTAQIAKSKPTPKLEKTTDNNKYLKRSEVEAQREAKYRAEQEELERQKEEKLQRKRKLDDEEAERKAERTEKRQRLAEESKRLKDEEDAEIERRRRKRLGLPELPQKSSTSQEGTPIPEEEDVPDEELVPKLRELGEPAKLFGEEHKSRLQRFRRLTGRGSGTPTRALTKGPIPTTLELVPEKDMKVNDKLPTTNVGRSFLFRQLASYFTMVLTEWGVALNQRPDEVKESYSGKAALNSMRQAIEDMRPFFRTLERGQMEDGVLEPVVEIVKAAQERRYVDANNGYLRLSIGKAAWPIGVTMVGIHERSSREKLHESDKAHIMSDETTRKYLQSMKRCLTFAQTRWPPDDQMQLMG